MMSNGPRSGFFDFTFASVHGFRFAVAAWNRGTPEPGTANLLYSSCASSSLTAFANANRNCSYVRGTARPWLAGFPITGAADLSAEIGSGSTPREGAGAL